MQYKVDKCGHGNGKLSLSAFRPNLLTGSIQSCHIIALPRSLTMYWFKLADKLSLLTIYKLQLCIVGATLDLGEPGTTFLLLKSICWQCLYLQHVVSSPPTHTRFTIHISNSSEKGNELDSKLRVKWCRDHSRYRWVPGTHFINYIDNDVIRRLFRLLHITYLCKDRQSSLRADLW